MRTGAVSTAGVIRHNENDIIMRTGAASTTGARSARRANDVIMTIASLKRYGDWRNMATGCNALVLIATTAAAAAAATSYPAIIRINLPYLSWQPQSKTGGFCCSKVLLPGAHMPLLMTTGTFGSGTRHSMTLPTLSVYREPNANVHQNS